MNNILLTTCVKHYCCSPLFLPFILTVILVFHYLLLNRLLWPAGDTYQRSAGDVVGGQYVVTVSITLPAVVTTIDVPYCSVDRRPSCLKPLPQHLTHSTIHSTT